MKKGKRIFKEYVEALSVALVAALILRALVIQAFRIPTGSMKDTLMVGDFLLVNKFVYGAKTPERIPLIDAEIPSIRFPAFKQPERGEIIVFKFPLDETKDYIKRCIGVPGDTVEVRNGSVWVNGNPEGDMELVRDDVYDPAEGHLVDYFQVTRPDGQQYVIRHYADYRSPFQNFGPVVIPEDHLFMMGDNRDNSLDSRRWGFMPMENLVGKALVIYWSWDKYASWRNVFAKVRWERIFGVIR